MVFTPAASLGHFLLNTKDWVRSRRKALFSGPPRTMSSSGFAASCTSRQPESEEGSTNVESFPAGYFIPEEPVPGGVDVTHVPQDLRSGVLCGTLRLACKIGDVSLNPEQWQFLLSLITPEEALKVKRYLREKDRKLALGSILLQRRVASWVMGERFHEVVFSKTDKNKPYVDTRFTRLPRWGYNVSHHGQYVVIATEADGSVGTDLVNLNDRPLDGTPSSEYLRHFERQLTTDEWRMLMAIQDETKRYDAFYRIWAMKEAYVKAIGMGLHFPLSRIDCAPGLFEGEEGHELQVDGLDTAGDWRISFFRLAPSYLWCTIVEQEAVDTAAGAVMPAAAAPQRRRPSARQRGRSTFHVLSLEDLVPEDRRDEWENLCLFGLPAGGQMQARG